MAGPALPRDYAPGVSAALTPASGWQRPPEVQAEFATSFQPPGLPMVPDQLTQDEGARSFQYRSGYNISQTPRAAEGLTPFGALHSMADVCDIARIAIRYRIEELSALDWSIVPRPGRSASNAQLDEAAQRMEKPDGILEWAEWAAVAIDEVLVTDALTVVPQRSLRGDVLSLDIADGSLFRPLVDAKGRTPQGSAPAYQQIIYGKVFWEGTYDQIIYAPKNRRSSSMYGRSPVEEIILTINRWLRREIFDLTYYDTSNVPAALVGAPADMTPEQIMVLQSWFDDVVSQVDRRRSIHFVPSNNGRLGVFEFRQPIADPAIEEHLITIICAAIGVQAQSLGFTTNANKANSSGQENIELRRRLPYLRFLTAIMRRLLTMMGYPDVMMQFQGDRPEEDKLKIAQEADLYIRNGTWSPDEVREGQGKEPTKHPRFVYTGTGPVALPSDATSIMAIEEARPVESADTGTEPDAVDLETAEGDDPTDAAAQVERRRKLTELRQWERYVSRSRQRPFEPRALDAHVSGMITTLLAAPEPGHDPQDWRKAVFSEARSLVLGASARLSAMASAS